mmetsp:Transcript_45405/g.33186  ORF Transcript_45405/g.33186 Transcript_45405/m.33186 type:complete len:88 (+) Transcript_45405:182-445(+)
MLNHIPAGTYSKIFKCLLGVDPTPEELVLKVDMIVTIGAMISNHLPISIFETLLEVLKKNGYYVFNVRASIWDGCELPYKEAIEKLI